MAETPIITWTQALTGIEDPHGNRFVGTAAPFPIQRLPAGTYLTDLSAGGFAAASTGTGLLAPRTLTNTDGTVTITNPDGVAGNPIINTTGLIPASRTVQGTAPIAIAGDHATHDLSANRVWSLDTNGVTYAFMQQASARTLLGNPTGGAANLQEITLGTGLSFSGSVLNATVTVPGITSLVGDGSATGPGAATFTLNNIPSGTTAAGSILYAMSVAPAAPAIGFGDLYADAFSFNIAFKNHAGVVNHGVQSRTAIAHQFATAIADDGTVTLAQPAFSDITGTITTSQIGVNVVTYGEIQQLSPHVLLGNPTGGVANVSEITLGTSLAFTGTSVGLATIANGTVLGNSSGGTAVPTAQTVLLPLKLVTGSLGLQFDASSLVLASGSTLVRGALTGVVTASAGFTGTTIAPHVVT